MAVEIRHSLKAWKHCVMRSCENVHPQGDTKVAQFRLKFIKPQKKRFIDGHGYQQSAGVSFPLPAKTPPPPNFSLKIILSTPMEPTLMDQSKAAEDFDPALVVNSIFITGVNCQRQNDSFGWS